MYKILPIVVCIFCGISLFAGSMYAQEKYIGILQNLSASFITIPLLFYSYEIVKKFSERKLNRELFDYAKVQVDSEILSVVHIFQNIFFSYDSSVALSDISEMIHAKKAIWEKHIAKTEFLGFQVYKSWGVPMLKIQKILENTYIINSLESSQLISLIHLVKSLNHWIAFSNKLRGSEIFINTNKKTFDYKILMPNSFSNSKEFPERRVLVRKIDKSQAKVVDFGDFNTIDEKLIEIYTINPLYTKYLANSIASVFESIREWINTTGKELLLDPKEFRISENKE
ncbi:MAG: hypothetical protein VB042_08320 [Victivallaceae bacterium]|nr:hypothetical protein [Victivallaceae bacterium]